MYVVYSDICTCGYLHVCSFGVYILIRIHYADLENISAYALIRIGIMQIWKIISASAE